MKFNNKLSFNSGFTLVELILVIAILAILAAVTIVAINPARQLAKSRDAKRTADVYAILSAIHHYEADHDGAWPAEITDDEQEICLTDAVDCSYLYDLSALTTNQEYLETIPADPLCTEPDSECDSNSTGYTVVVTAAGRVLVSAPRTELGDVVFVSR